MIGATEEQDDPMPLPALKKSINGWSGKGDNFRVVENVIKIKKTDAHPSHVPSEDLRQLTMDNEGIFSQYVQPATGSDIYQLWMRKIGPYLGDWVLGKNRYGAIIILS